MTAPTLEPLGGNISRVEWILGRTSEICKSAAMPVVGTGPVRKQNSRPSVMIRALPSVLWDCSLGVGKSIRPVKIEWQSAGVVICLQRDANDLQSSWCHCHPIISCFVKIQNGLTLLVPAYPGCPGKEAIKWVPVSDDQTLQNWVLLSKPGFWFWNSHSWVWLSVHLAGQQSRRVSGNLYHLSKRFSSEQVVEED